MLSYPGSPPTHHVTGLAAAPSILLILGSLFLAAWRATGRRTGWAAEAAIASLALLAGLLLGRSIPARSSFALWPPVLSPSASIELELTPWSWALLVCVLAFGVFRALRSASNGSPSRAGAQSASLVFTAMIAVSTVAASLLTLVLTWTLVIVAQTWLVSTSGPGQGAGPPWRLIQTSDFATLLLLIGAFGLTGAEKVTAQLPIALLALAGLTRVWSAVHVRKLGDGWVATLGFPATASVLAALAWGWGVEYREAPASWLAVVGLALLLGGWLSGWLADAVDHRTSGWIAGVSGMALVAAAASPDQVEAPLAAAAALLILAGALAVPPLQGKVSARIGAGIAVLMMVGIPGLPAAILFGATVPGASASALGWVAVAGAGLLASMSLRDALSPKADPDPQWASPMASVAAVMMTALGVTFYLRLRALVPPPAPAAVPVALIAAIVGAAVRGRIPDSQRVRIARALRWPSAITSPRRAAAAAGPVEAFVRGARDVLEGDASLLWALVVVVVGLLLLQGAM